MASDFNEQLVLIVLPLCVFILIFLTSDILITVRYRNLMKYKQFTLRKKHNKKVYKNCMCLR